MLPGNRQGQAKILIGMLSSTLCLEIASCLQQTSVTAECRCLRGCQEIVGIEGIGRGMDQQLLHLSGIELFREQAQPLLNRWTGRQILAMALVTAAPADQKMLPR